MDVFQYDPPLRGFAQIDVTGGGNLVARQAAWLRFTLVWEQRWRGRSLDERILLRLLIRRGDLKVLCGKIPLRVFGFDGQTRRAERFPAPLVRRQAGGADLGAAARPPALPQPPGPGRLFIHLCVAALELLRSLSLVQHLPLLQLPHALSAPELRRRDRQVKRRRGLRRLDVGAIGELRRGFPWSLQRPFRFFDRCW